MLQPSRPCECRAARRLEPSRAWPTRPFSSARLRRARRATRLPLARARGVTRELLRPLLVPAGFPRRSCSSTRRACSPGWRALGAHADSADGVAGTRFAVWAPNAERVSVVGDFNAGMAACTSHARRAAERRLGVVHPGHGEPASSTSTRSATARPASCCSRPTLTRGCGVRPVNGARVTAPAAIPGATPPGSSAARRRWLHAPLSIYEVHLGSWRRHPDGRPSTTASSPTRSCPYVVETGLHARRAAAAHRAPARRVLGLPADRLSSRRPAVTARPMTCAISSTRCHPAGIGVILDWVPGHFPQRRLGARALRRHRALRARRPAPGLHPDWGTHIFNYGRNEVRSFLLSSAHYWLEEFHFDGLRVDAVASMLYLDYSRKAGEWCPNRYGGQREPRGRRVPARAERDGARASSPARSPSPRSPRPGRGVAAGRTSAGSGSR